MSGQAQAGKTHTAILAALDMAADGEHAVYLCSTKRMVDYVGNLIHQMEDRRVVKVSRPERLFTMSSGGTLQIRAVEPVHPLYASNKRILIDPDAHDPSHYSRSTLADLGEYLDFLEERVQNMTEDLQWGPIHVQDGKYTFQSAEDGWSVDVLRYGEPWLNIQSGHKAILALAFEVEELREAANAPRYFCTTHTCGACAGCKAAAAVAEVQAVFPNAQVETLLCSKCSEPQFDTPSGMTCKNGHGG